MKIIGFCGAPGAGKDTAASFLVENHDFAHVKFARELRTLCSQSFKIPEHYLSDEAFKDEKFAQPIEIDEEDYIRFTDLLGHNFMSSTNYDNLKKVMLGKKLETPRELLQYIGTDIIRNGIDADYFVNCVKDKLRYWESKESDVVISDVRFENEVRAIKAAGGSVYQILREESKKNSHVAENRKLDVDGIICNNGSVKELELQLEAILNER